MKYILTSDRNCKYILLLMLMQVNCGCSETSSVNPSDTDPRIDVTLPLAHIGSIDIDMDLLNSYQRQPDSIMGFFAEARKMFQTDRDARFADNAFLAGSAEKYNIQHLGGPLLGDLGPDSASVWIRTVRPSQVKVKAESSDGKMIVGYAASSAQTDLTSVVRLTELKPDTKYRYQIFVDDQFLKLNQKTVFTTFPSPDCKGVFQIAFGGDFHKSGIHNIHLMKQIRQRGNQAMILTGDSAVDDRNNVTALHRSDYLLRDLSPAWQGLAAAMPIYATWDDHDYFDDDLSGIPEGFTAEDVRAVREVWTQNWNNPGYGDGKQGIYFRTRIGPADLIMLDTRSLRKTPNTKNAFLGDKQMAWLKQQLLQCQGPFVILSSPTMWSDYVTNAKDSWGVWDTEGREELFTLIEKNRIPGVLLISGDRHGTRAFKIPRPSGHTFYEFEVGTLGGMPGPDAIAEKAGDLQLFGRANLKAFGEFEFDTTKTDPQVTFRLVDERGGILEEISILQSQLTPGGQ